MAPSNRHGQLALDIESPAEQSGILCRGLFSPNYLTRHFRDTDKENSPSANETRPIYEAAKARCQDHLRGLRKQKEAYTRTAFLDPLLADLGWRRSATSG